MATISDYCEMRPCSLDEYHAELEHDSPSSLALFRQSPKLYYHRRITKRFPQPAPTRAMLMGTATHAAILEPETLDDLFAIPPREVLTSDGARRGKAYDAWAEAHTQLIVTQAEADAIRWMVDSVHDNPAAAELLEQIEYTEKSIFWRDGDVGGKARFDAASVAIRTIVDIKTSHEPGEEWGKLAARLGAHNQAAWYLDAFRRMFGVRAEMIHIVVGNEPPYECFVWRLPAAAITAAAQANARTVADLQACRSGKRLWVTPGSLGVNELKWPEWAR